jgi:hypothetical protein
MAVASAYGCASGGEALAIRSEPLRGESTADAPSRTAAGEPPIIDAKAYTIEADSPQPARATSAQPLVFGEMLDCTPKRSRLSLRDVSKRVPPSAADMVPAAARFIEGTHSNLAGGRAYRLFIPSRYVGQPLPLIVMLHGCTQSPEDFAAGTRMNFIAEERTCFVVYPAQHSKANQAKCWNWFRTADQQRGRGEPSLIARITRQIMRDYSVDPRRVSGSRRTIRASWPKSPTGYCRKTSSCVSRISERAAILNQKPGQRCGECSTANVEGDPKVFAMIEDLRARMAVPVESQ